MARSLLSSSSKIFIFVVEGFRKNKNCQPSLPDKMKTAELSDFNEMIRYIVTTRAVCKYRAAWLRNSELKGEDSRQKDNR